MRNHRGFTLIEIIIAISVLLLILMMAVPSVTGVLADRRLRRSLDDFNALVRTAQERSTAEHRPYLIAWGKEGIAVRPEVVLKEDDPAPVATFPAGEGGAVEVSLGYALTKDPPPEWIFWPSGNCEPATIKYAGRSGTWTADYSPLTGTPTLRNYAPK